MVDLKIKISEDFSKSPSCRYREHGRFSGEEFREDMLEKKYLQSKKNGCKLIVDISDVKGLPPSFLEEAFGGLQRIYKNENVLDVIEINCLDNEKHYYDEIKFYVDSALAEVEAVVW